MAIKPVYNCFHPILNKPTIEFSNIDQEAFQIAKDLQDTLNYISNGVGLAANQIGYDKSILLVDVRQIEEYANTQPLIMINPEIILESDNKLEMQEGCLSIPDLYEYVLRPERVEVRYWNLNEKEIIKEFDGYIARVIQHEIDHLDGILFFQHLSSFKRTLIKNKLNKIRKGEILPDYSFVLPDGTLVTPDKKTNQ